MSYKQLIADILNAQADQLIAKSNTSRDYITLFPDQTDLHALLHLAAHLSTALVPVKPTEKFRTELYQDLMTTAHRTLTEPQPTTYNLQALRSPKISIPLTMVITLLVGFFWRRRRQRATDLVPILSSSSDQDRVNIEVM